MRALVVAVLLVPALALAEECKELRAPDDQVQRQIQIAKSEPVQAIRKGIDEYLRGCRSSCRMLEPGAVADLGELDLAYLKSKFSLYLGDRFPGGGFMFTIVFQDRPDAFPPKVRVSAKPSGATLRCAPPGSALQLHNLGSGQLFDADPGHGFDAV